MALEIKPSPVLTGKAAQDFYKLLEQAKESKPAKEVREITGRVRKHLASNTLWHPK
ncbi:MAG: hypothetical protein LBK18_08245 [Prevotellaceae bacterium]|jgi:hypothetical protein|nr:hypothetical protein [Prevotellaceae bacterium]